MKLRCSLKEQASKLERSLPCIFVKFIDINYLCLLRADPSVSPKAEKLIVWLFLQIWALGSPHFPPASDLFPFYPRKGIEVKAGVPRRPSQATPSTHTRSAVPFRHRMSGQLKPEALGPALGQKLYWLEYFLERKERAASL